MANGIKAMRKLQLYIEAVQGTAGVATIPWRGTGVLEDLGVPVEAPEDVGYMGGVDRYYIPYQGAAMGLDPVPASFEHLPLLLECGVKAVGTGVADGGGGSGKIYTYPMPTTTPNTIRTYTIEGGDNNEKEEASYFFAEEIKISGKGKGAVEMSAKMTGRGVSVLEYSASMAFVASTKKITDAALGLAGFVTGTTIKVTDTANNDGLYTVATGGVAAEIVVTEALVDEGANPCTIQDWFSGGPTGLTLPTLEVMNFSKSKLYIDLIAGTIGSTLKSNTLLGFELTNKTGWMAVPSGDGTSSFGFIKCADPVVTLDITFEHNGYARAEKAFYKALTSRLLQLKIEGSALATAGTTYTYKTFLANLAGKWTKFSVLGEQNGNDIVTGTFMARWSATASKYAEFVVVNSLATL